MEELIKIDLAFDAKINFYKLVRLLAKTLCVQFIRQRQNKLAFCQRLEFPNLIDLMLPKGSPSNCKNIIRNLFTKSTVRIGCKQYQANNKRAAIK